MVCSRLNSGIVSGYRRGLLRLYLIIEVPRPVLRYNNLLTLLSIDIFQSVTLIQLNSSYIRPRQLCPSQIISQLGTNLKNICNLTLTATQQSPLRQTSDHYLRISWHIIRRTSSNCNRGRQSLFKAYSVRTYLLYMYFM